MKTAEEIIRETNNTKWDGYGGRLYSFTQMKSAMQEYAQQIASLAWDAGQNYQGERTEYGGITRTAPDKEQFLNSIFNKTCQ